MKKACILTWYKYPNFGSVLQAFALNYYISENLNIDVEFLNYNPNPPFPKGVIERNLDFHRVFQNVNKYIFRKKNGLHPDLLNKNKYFSSFIENYFKQTDVVKSESEMRSTLEDFDYAICGSDQIWSPFIFDKKFFFGNISSDRCKFISYATSFGTADIDKFKGRNLKDLLEKFSSLSVREKSGIKIIEHLSGKYSCHVCDPTLLLNEDDWLHFEEKPINFDETDKYVLAYFLGNNFYYKKYIKYLENIGKRVIIIPSSNTDYFDKRSLKNLTPENFIYLIRHADFILTDSFHATIFSLNFKKPFLTLSRFKQNEKNSQNERIHSILDICNLKERFAKKFSAKILKKSLANYVISSSLSKHIEFSKQYLKESLSNKKDVGIGKFYITEHCSGCGVCASSCLKKAITIKENCNGFYEAMINSELCVKCGNCQRVCGRNNKGNNILNGDCFSLRLLDNEELMKHSSGGASYAFAEVSGQLGYKFVGCVYMSNSKRAEHHSSDYFNYYAFSGSKYLQSSFYKAMDEINFDDRYLIVGTPCQIASIDAFLKKNNKRNNFILVDLICHGIPSYLAWDSYISYSRKKFFNNSDINSVSFRYKLSHDNNNMNMMLSNGKKSLVIPKNHDYFMKTFCSGLIYNESCFDCKFRTESCADLRIGDFWGNKYKNHPGTSLVIVLTESGKEIFDRCNGIAAINNENISNYLENQQMQDHLLPDDYYSAFNFLKSGKRFSSFYRKYISKFYTFDSIKRWRNK